MNLHSTMQVILASLFTLVVSILFPKQGSHVQKNSVTPPPTISVSQVPSISETPAEVNSFHDFIYPGSTITNNTDGSITLSSTDDPNTITQWYENQITQHNMHNTSISQTNSNNTILNTIDASSTTQEIKIIIQRPEGEQHTTVILSTTSQ